MKRYFAIISLLLASIITIYGQNTHSNDSESVIIEINKSKINWSTDIERSIDYSIIEAVAYPKQGLVKVTLYNVGDAIVSLKNSNNEVVSSDYVQTDMLTIICLYAFSTSGTYYLEISSPSWYAEGMVTF